MTFETLFQLDPKIWPLAVMAFLRVMSILMWLPIFGDTTVPGRLRLLFALALTFCLWPTWADGAGMERAAIPWSPVFLALTTVKEVLFGFAVGFAARLVLYSTQIAANLVGISMGFQASQMFSRITGDEGSPFSEFKYWLVLVVMLTLNIHHFMIKEIAASFAHVPLASSLSGTAFASAASISQSGIAVVRTSFLLGIKLAAPLLTVQLLIMLGLGLLGRVIPQLNLFVANFPLSFVVSMVVLFLAAGMFIRVIGDSGLRLESEYLLLMRRAFSPVPAGG